ncbi:MAG: glycosyltransferase family 2 protein [Bdellovibrionales bacterium]|nr:glycosyltransferase family 2 protein [Bdellovibrionales bacterium]
MRTLPRRKRKGGRLIYVLVAVHGRREITRRFLEALKRQTVSAFKVVVVDDGSTDGTGEMLARDFPDVAVLRGNGDLWWTGAMRKGVDWVLERAGAEDYVICANNDQIPKENAIATLLKESREYGGAIVGSLSRDFSDPTKLYDAAFSWNWKTNRYARVPIGDQGRISAGVDVLTCRFTIVPVEVFRKINFEPSLFPHYLGDYDFFLTVKRSGYRLVLSYDSIVYDVGGPSGNFRSGWNLTLAQLRDNYFSIRSHANVIYMTRFFFRHCPSLFFKLVYIARLGLKIVLQFLSASVITLTRKAGSAKA